MSSEYLGPGVLMSGERSGLRFNQKKMFDRKSEEVRTFDQPRAVGLLDSFFQDPRAF